MESFFSLFWLFFIAIIVYQVLEFFKNQGAPEVAVPATLVDKRMRAHNHVDANGLSNQSVTYYFLFELENGEHLKFTVGYGKYKNYVIGDYGILRYQRKKFNSLDR